MMVRTDTVRSLGKFDERYRLCEDYDLWLTLARDHPIAATDEVVTNYRGTLAKAQGSGRRGTMKSTSG